MSGTALPLGGCRDRRWEVSRGQAGVGAWAFLLLIIPTFTSTILLSPGGGGEYDEQRRGRKAEPTGVNCQSHGQRDPGKRWLTWGSRGAPGMVSRLWEEWEGGDDIEGEVSF